MAAGRRAGVPGPGRRAGEAARLPDRAGRDRGGAAAAGGRVAGGGDRARRMASGGQRLVGYVVAAAGAAVDAAALRAALSRQLPDYMVPSALVVLERLPLTPNGKLDRRALPEPELGGAAFASGAAHAAGGDPVRAVCRGAGRRAGRRRRQLLRARRALAAGDAADQPDPGGARCRGGDPQPVRGAERRGAGAAACRRRRRRCGRRLCRMPRPAEIPLSYAQRRLWFLERLEGISGTYVIPLAVRLTGALDRAALEAALGDLVERHESLRTLFPDRLGVPRQQILPARAARPRLEIGAVDEAGLAGGADGCGRAGLRSVARAAAAGASVRARPRRGRAGPSMCC